MRVALTQYIEIIMKSLKKKMEKSLFMIFLNLYSQCTSLNDYDYCISVIRKSNFPLSVPMYYLYDHNGNLL